MIFALDDEEFALELIEQALASLGPVTVTQRWSTLIRPLMRGEGRILLVCDLKMPGMDGATFCGIVRRHAAHVKIIMFTSAPDEGPAGVADMIVDKKQGPEALLRAAKILLSLPSP